MSAPITGLYVVGNATLLGGKPPPLGYSSVEVDMNNGVTGATIYLCYTTAPSIGKPITGIEILVGDVPPAANYTKIHVNLNATTGGKPLYLCFTTYTGASDAAWTDVTVIASTNENVEPEHGWKRFNKDCNEGNTPGNESIIIMFICATNICEKIWYCW